MCVCVWRASPQRGVHSPGACWCSRAEKVNSSGLSHLEVTGSIHVSSEVVELINYIDFFLFLINKLHVLANN